MIRANLCGNAIRWNMKKKSTRTQKPKRKPARPADHPTKLDKGHGDEAKKQTLSVNPDRGLSREDCKTTAASDAEIQTR